jgi:hypothetical protein
LGVSENGGYFAEEKCDQPISTIYLIFGYVFLRPIGISNF